jgi:SAM-dependent methyltransferase
MLWSRLRARLFAPPAELYLRVDRVDELVQALQSVQHKSEICEQKISAVAAEFTSLKATLRAEVSSLRQKLETEVLSVRGALQRFSIGSPDMIPRQLAEAIAYRGDDSNALYRAFVGTDRPISSAATPVPLTSSLCQQYQFLLDQYRFWMRAMKIKPRFHRKHWEWFYIAQALFEHGLLMCGKRGIGFGVGREPLPSLFASLGVQIVASDQSIEAAERAGWAKSNQHSQDITALNDARICTDDIFSRLVSFMEVDMNDIPSRLDEEFDFCWSSCSLEHLGSLRHGFAFIENSLRTLKPGGCAVHTTEFNLSSQLDTIESKDLSIYRRSDIDEFLGKMTDQGFIVLPIDWTLGEGFAEMVVDLPPFGGGEPHIRLKAGDYDTTSIGMIIQKPS